MIILGKKSKVLFTVGILCGLVPLLGGLSIFFTWWGAREFAAVDLKWLEETGFYWIKISFFIAIAGLLILFLHLYLDFRKNLRLFFIGIAVVLINIPSCLWVVHKVFDISEKKYFKIYNASKQDDLNILVEVESRGFKKKIGSFDDGSGVVYSYYSQNPNGPEDYSVPSIDVMVTNKENYSRHFSIAAVGSDDCFQFYLDKELNLHDVDGKILVYEFND